MTQCQSPEPRHWWAAKFPGKPGATLYKNGTFVAEFRNESDVKRIIRLLDEDDRAIAKAEGKPYACYGCGVYRTALQRWFDANDARSTTLPKDDPLVTVTRTMLDGGLPKTPRTTASAYAVAAVDNMGFECTLLGCIPPDPYTDPNVCRGKIKRGELLRIVDVAIEQAVAAEFHRG